MKLYTIEETAIQKQLFSEEGSPADHENAAAVLQVDYETARTTPTALVDL